MKQTALFIIGLTIVAFPAAGGGLNRIGGMGPRHGALSGSYADDSALFCYNPAGLANFQRSYADLSVEVFTPHFRLKNRLTGRSNASAQNGSGSQLGEAAFKCFGVGAARSGGGAGICDGAGNSRGGWLLFGNNVADHGRSQSARQSS